MPASGRCLGRWACLPPSVGVSPWRVCLRLGGEGRWRDCREGGGVGVPGPVSPEFGACLPLGGVLVDGRVCLFGAGMSSPEFGACLPLGNVSLYGRVCPLVMAQ